MATMKTPAYYDAVPSIVMVDPLAQILGSAEDGLLDYRYIDAVKLTGHSCPTVAGAWLMIRAALAQLYPGGTPRRGDIRVELRQPLDEGVTGVVASVAALVTGAANAGGFKGLAGQFGRKDLLQFAVPMDGDIRFTRTDTAKSVAWVRRGFPAPRSAALAQLMRDALARGAPEDARRAFASAWSAWVAQLLQPGGESEWVAVATR